MVWSRFWTACRAIFSVSSRRSSVLKPVAETESVTRFLFHSSQFAKMERRVRAPAIASLRHPGTGRLELSVYRADGATASELWGICEVHVDNKATARVAKARGTCLAGTFSDEGFSFDPDGIPHPRHANVIGWRDDIPKHELKNIQQKIARAMKLEGRDEA
jgi:hypothetical protein